MVETRVRAIVHAFLLLFFIFWLRKCVYDCSYTRFLCFFSFLFIFWLRKRVYEQSYTRFFFYFYFLAPAPFFGFLFYAFFFFFFFFFFSGFGNMCTSNRTRVSYVFFIFF